MSQLAAAMDRYSILQDAFEVVLAMVRSPEQWRRFVADDNFFMVGDQETCRTSVANCRKELDEMFVLSLVAIFERLLPDASDDLVHHQFSISNETHRKFRDAVRDDVEYWTFRERLLEVFATVPQNIRGQVKQAIGYRDWVAHGRKYGSTPELPIANVTPLFAFKILSSFLAEANLHPQGF
jgi:hypothetical protein